MNIVIVKTFDTSKNPQAKKLRLQQAERLKLLNHPNIMRILDFGEANNSVFWVIEYIDGVTLNQIIPKDEGLSLQELWPIFKQIADGVMAAHSQQILHLDLKPANILVSNHHVTIIDFGNIYSPGRGTAGYVAPEVVLGNGKPDTRADVYALGVLLAFLLTGRKPFTGKTPEQIVAEQLTAEISVLNESYLGHSKALQEIVLKATRKNPKDRYVDIGALIGHLFLILKNGV